MPAPLADAQLTEWMAQLTVSGAPPARVAGVAALRAGAEARAAARPRGPWMHSVEDVELAPAGVRARLYLPGPDAGRLVLYAHGGGWVFGDLASHDRACRRLAAASGAAVLSLDYRRAPEDPWPAAVDDVVDALRWVDRGEPPLARRPAAVAVAGDSAGGALAALACLRAREEADVPMPALQVLLYPTTDLTAEGGSMDEEGQGYGLTADDVRWFAEQWVPDPALWGDGRVSALHAADLRGLPPAVVVTCEHDPLRDQGEAYARRLREAGVPVTLRREPGMVHNFLLWDTVSPACAAAGDRVAADVAAGLGIVTS